MFNIKDFTSSINTAGVLKTNKYIATVTLGKDHYLRGFLNQNDERLFSIRCDSIQLPGVSLASADGPPRLGYGPVEKHPYSANFDDMSLTFIVDADSRIHRMLYNWVNAIVNFQSFGGDNLTQANGPTKASAYEVGYRNKYAAELQVDVYRDTGKNTNQKSMTFKAYKAFPMAFPSSGLNWNEGELLKLNIPFAYTDYSIKYFSFNDTPTTNSATETGRDGNVPALTTEQQIDQELSAIGGIFVPFG